MPRMQNMKKKLEELKPQVGEVKMGIVPFLSVDEDLHVVVNPVFEEEGRKYRELDKRLAAAKEAVAEAFEKGKEVCERLDVPLDTPPDACQAAH